MTIKRHALHLMVALLLTGVCLARRGSLSRRFVGSGFRSRETRLVARQAAPARDYSKTLATEAVFIVVDGQVLAQWGKTRTRYNVHSIRKSFMSALYGIHIRDGDINLSWTLAQLGIDDNQPSLTAVEKKATLHDLIEARSGVYHPAAYETEGMKDKRRSAAVTRRARSGITTIGISTSSGQSSSGRPKPEFLPS